MGFRFGFGGMQTYPNARHLSELAERLPLDSIVLETDAPEYLPEVATILGELRDESVKFIARTTTNNAFAALRIGVSAIGP